MSFDELRKANTSRCEQSFHGIDRWTPAEWACAMAGEAGEACNVVKKMRRLAFAPEQISSADWPAFDALRNDLKKELADIVAYADLLAARMEINLGQAVAEKFNEVSERVGSKVRLPVPGWTGKPCPKCKGSGQGAGDENCGACAGTGEEYGIV